MIELKQEIKEVKELLNTYIGFLNTHISKFEKHEENEKTQYNTVMTKLTESCTNTQGLVELWNAATGTIKVLSVIGSVIKWMSGIAIGVGSLWFLIHEHILPTK